MQINPISIGIGISPVIQSGPLAGGGAAPGADALLLETADFILLETGDKILLE